MNVNKNRIKTNRIKTVYAVIFFTLCQLLSSTVFALTFESEQGGKYLTVCTMQGYKQVWVDLEEKQDTNVATLECAYCLLHISALDAINLDTSYGLIVSNERIDALTTIQNNIQSKMLCSFLAIRAPPFILS